MHEMDIALQIVEIAQASIPPSMARAQVVSVYLRIGKLSAVVAESLGFCFKVLTQDTSLARAQLKIEQVPVTADCCSCGHTWVVDLPMFRCPQCESGNIEILSGRELEIKAIELADDSDPGQLSVRQ
jgi:hydrogenase nickel incorporation protein HypA/HybF